MQEEWEEEIELAEPPRFINGWRPSFKRENWHQDVDGQWVRQEGHIILAVHPYEDVLVWRLLQGGAGIDGAPVFSWIIVDSIEDGMARADKWLRKTLGNTDS